MLKPRIEFRRRVLLDFNRYTALDRRFRQVIPVLRGWWWSFVARSLSTSSMAVGSTKQSLRWRHGCCHRHRGWKRYIVLAKIDDGAALCALSFCRPRVSPSPTRYNVSGKACTSGRFTTSGPALCHRTACCIIARTTSDRQAGALCRMWMHSSSSSAIVPAVLSFLFVIIIVPTTTFGILTSDIILITFSASNVLSNTNLDSLIGQ